jgi:cytochrome c5
LAAAGDPDTGEKVYKETCSVCHAAGLLNAPKFGDKAAWRPRVAKGKDTLYNDALKGLNAMPPRGGNNTLKDEEVKAAVDFMLSKSS